MNGKLKKRALQIAQSPVYQRAYEDPEFLHREELRPVRLQLELLKPQMLQDAAGIQSTVVVFGGARIHSPEDSKLRLKAARQAVKRAPGNVEMQNALKRAERAFEFSNYYDQARLFAKLVSQQFKNTKDKEFVIVTGGGPGIMEAANRGAFEAKCPSIGLNITLPHEQLPNPYITPELCFRFHYFALRKMHFLLRAKAAAFFPGGFGTLDEMFETLTLIQTEKIPPFPIVLFGREFWDSVIDFNHMAEAGTISPEDMGLFTFADDYKSAWNHIAKFYGMKKVK